MNVGDFLRRGAAVYGDRVAVVDEPGTPGSLGSLTYRQVEARGRGMSLAFDRMGVGQGERVAIVSPNSARFYISYFGVSAHGRVLVPINFRLTAEEVGYIVAHSGATVLLVDPESDANLTGVDAKHRMVLDGSADAELFAEASEGAQPEDWAADEGATASINYTSGTTSRPKGVMITHRNAAMNSIGTLLHLPVGIGERYLWTLPMFHANGWTYTWTVTAAAATHVCLRKVEPAAVFQLLRDEQVRLLCAAPTVLISLASASQKTRGTVPAGVRVVTAGAPPAAATIERLEDEFGWEVTHVYGLTETAPFILVCAPLPEHEALSPADRAVVKARQGVELLTSGELRVIDDEGQEVAADAGTLGEIAVRGNVVMAGYYNDPEATKRAMGDGWFHTGDAAVVHPDGYVEIRDRLKDVIISGGENISSVEVEGTLLRHPAVQEVAIVGLPHEKWGEAPHAFVVLAEGAAATEQELIAFTRDRLAHFKAPHAVTFVDELPKTATGKIQKYVLRGGQAAISRQ